MLRIFVLALLGSAWLASPASAAGDAARGQTLFKQRCAVCHAVSGTAAGMGPNLAKVYGRKAAATPFSYSPAMRKSGLTWDAATLSTYLAAPAKAVPGGQMVVAIPNAKHREDIVEFLRTLR